MLFRNQFRQTRCSFCFIFCIDETFTKTDCLKLYEEFPVHKSVCYGSVLFCVPIKSNFTGI